MIKIIITKEEIDKLFRAETFEEFEKLYEEFKRDISIRWGIAEAAELMKYLFKED